MNADLVQRVRAAMDEAEQVARNAERAHDLRPLPLGEMPYDTAAHLKRWDPQRVQRLVTLDRALLGNAVLMDAVPGDAPVIAEMLLVYLAARWGVTP